MYLLTIPTRSRLFGLNSLIIPSRNAIFLGSSPIAFCRRRILNTSQPDVILSRWPPGISSPQTCTRLSRFLWSSSPLRLFKSILKGLIETIIEFSATILSIFKRFMLCNCVNLTSAFTLCDPPPPPPPRTKHHALSQPLENLVTSCGKNIIIALWYTIFYLPYKSATPIPYKKGESPKLHGH